MTVDKLNKLAFAVLNELRSGAHKQNTGWLNLPLEITDEYIEELNEVADKVREKSEVFVVVGVGGSYLGSKAVIEALTNKYSEKEIEIMYLGNSLSALDLQDSLDYLKDKDFTINVISKSGSTLEVSLAFRLLRNLMFDKYGEKEAYERMIVTTGKGGLRDYAVNKGIKTYAIPEDVGGRFSVLTTVGLLPIAVAGLNVRALTEGARDELVNNSKISMSIDESYPEVIELATRRVHLSRQGKDIEILAYYEPRLRYFAEWWKQLYGESEGKDGKGVFPASACFTTDLHSIGQIIQDGKRNVFETHLSFNVELDLSAEISDSDFDNLNRLGDRKVSELNSIAKQGAVEAHRAGGVPSIEINRTNLDERSLGSLIYLFQLSCAISAIMMGVNPFDQPGVEEYKSRIKSRLD